MRIAIFSDSLPPRMDGIAVAVQQLTIGLVRSGHQVLLIGPGPTVIGHRVSMIASGEHGATGLWFLRLPSVPTPFDGYRGAVPLRRRMRRALREFGPDVVSAQTVGPVGLIGLSLARRQGVPSLFTWHTDFETYGRAYRILPRLLAAGSYAPWILEPRVATRPGPTAPISSPRPRMPIPFPGTRRPIASRGTRQPVLTPGTRGLIPASLRRASRWMSAVCAPASGSAEQVRRFGLQRPVFVLPADVTADDLGVGTEAARRALRRVPDPGGTPYLLFVGRLSREKNLALLLDAFGHGVPAPARLVLVGPANDARISALLQARVAQWPGRIVVLGSLPRAELGEIYRAAAAFVTPSRSETQCLCVSEAVALAVPVIVVDPQLAWDRPPGAVQVVRPEPQALALAMTNAMTNAMTTALTETMARAEADAMTEPMARAEADAMSGRTGRLPVAPAAPDSLAFRFVAAAEAVGSVPEGTTLRWQAGRWIESGTPG